METKTFNSPLDLISYLGPSEEKMRTPSALASWYWRAKLWHDPNVCGCKKKNMNQAQIDEGYKNIINWPESEKIGAKNIIGGAFTLLFNGETIGTI